MIALDLGGTKLAGCLFRENGESTGRRSVPLASRQGDAVGELIIAEMRRLERTSARRGWRVTAIGICVPGIVRGRTGRVWAPNIGGWENYPLRAELRSALADPRIDVVVENDRAASILGEVWRGAAQGCRDAIFLAVGTGIGAGILAHGRVLRGSHDVAGAIGWLALDRPFRDAYRHYGCFESHASGNGIARSAREAVARSRRYRGLLRGNMAIAASEVFAAYDAGDVLATKMVTEAIEFWGMASANLVSLFNPEMIVFGGGVFGPAARYLDQIEVQARRWAQPVAIEQVRFAASTLGGNAALCGAASAAMRRARMATS